ncbi:MAG: glycosyltransferase family 2 protein [Coriobacteriia bacterium]
MVIPSFNQAPFLEDAISSVLEQGYPDLELFVMDGGSTDGSKAIIEHYADRLTYWQSRQDKGQIDALIQGFGRATGEVMGWINSDDVLLPHALQRIAEAYVENPSAGMFIGNFILIDSKGAITRCKRNPPQVRWFGQHGKSVINPDWFFSRCDFERAGGLTPNLDFGMDTDLSFKMILCGSQPAFVDSYLIGFRKHPASKGVSKPDCVREDRRQIEAYLRQRGVVFNHPLCILAYVALQVANGNYLRMILESRAARGQYWRDWCTARYR